MRARVERLIAACSGSLSVEQVLRAAQRAASAFAQYLKAPTLCTQPQSTSRRFWLQRPRMTVQTFRPQTTAVAYFVVVVQAFMPTMTRRMAAVSTLALKEPRLT